MIYELRRYYLFPHNKKAFHERFENHAIPTMEKYGFQLIGAWDKFNSDPAGTILRFFQHDCCCGVGSDFRSR